MDVLKPGEIYQNSEAQFKMWLLIWQSLRSKQQRNLYWGRIIVYKLREAIRDSLLFHDQVQFHMARCLLPSRRRLWRLLHPGRYASSWLVGEREWRVVISQDCASNPLPQECLCFYLPNTREVLFSTENRSTRTRITLAFNIGIVYSSSDLKPG